MFKNIPNILTVLRFLLIPIILKSIFAGNYLLAFVFFTLSGITDVLDGFIARKFNLISNFGKLMDPLADKLTQISVLAALVTFNLIPVWILVIVIFKELIMVLGASFLYGKDVVVYSKWYGKLATVLFYLAIVISLITSQFNITVFWEGFTLIIYCIAIVATVSSLVMYVKCLYQNGFIDKNDLNAENKNVAIKSEKDCQ
ncbi:MAG: CDP-diacylglycerol--glycerol-3-phosphate 3-phosphatidyltransferase [Clostridia bacterium]|jgi:cardiolipin synthase|nr:CDP-diacylglycerol--glycerol-3-phosphate 3-phosphatidyltransferase [Clostridia bacterium]